MHAEDYLMAIEFESPSEIEDGDHESVAWPARGIH
jgi:hypothetical protein